LFTPGRKKKKIRERRHRFTGADHREGGNPYSPHHLAPGKGGKREEGKPQKEGDLEVQLHARRLLRGKPGPIFDTMGKRENLYAFTEKREEKKKKEKRSEGRCDIEIFKGRNGKIMQSIR